MNYSKNTDRLDIYINDQAKTITIRQRWKYVWRYDAQKSIKPWAVDEKQYFHKQAVFLIKSIWETAPRVNIRGDSDFVKSNAGRSFQFRFDIEKVNAGEHWTISANKVPNGSKFRSWTDWRNGKIVLDILDTGSRVIHFNGHTNYQIPVVHEFGHAIGNVPSIYGGSQGDEYTVGSPLDSFIRLQDISPYHTDYSSVMNRGSDLRARHFEYLLRELNTMISSTTFYFNPLARW